MTRYAAHMNARNNTPQTEKADPSQVANEAGGYSFALDDWKRLDRFLILGAEGGSYYASERKMTLENAKNVLELIKSDGIRVVERVAEISDEGRAPKNDPAIFVLALCAALGNAETKKSAFNALSKVCRTGTHLFQFVESISSQRGWGRSLREGIANWYNSKETRQLAYQLFKYKQRDGWSHRDLLRKSHAKAASADHDALFSIVVSGGKTEKKISDVRTSAWVNAVAQVATETDKKKVANLILEHNLPREVLPTEMLNAPEIWEALLEKMPATALLRNLGNLSKSGVLKPLSAGASKVISKLSDHEWLCKSRIHPFSVLLAMTTYAQGHGMKGKNTWTVVQSVVDALDKAFYGTFKGVEPTGKRMLLGLDVSGSMAWEIIAGTPISARDGSAVMSLVTAATELNYHIFGFCDRFVELNISPRDRLDSVIRKIANLPFGGTDCSLPMEYALQNKLEVDQFVIYTDNQTYAGRRHPHEALRTYREKMGINAKLIVVGMTSNDFTIADPNDAGMLDIVGFDSNAPHMISQFAAGQL